ncbi:MAG: hypothetical protein C0614_09235 [Desulfuromonas sp.]|nr:MAG: hypothetical protein C0614_09235 [Desulfuromonas sp.]
MKRQLALFVTVSTLCSLIGCAWLYPPEKQGRGHLDNFVYALRWMQFSAAAAYLKPELRDGFLAQFDDTKDLTVVDVRLDEVTLSPDGKQIETKIEMDYYLLPSTTIKTFPILQTWNYFELGKTGGDYLIVTPFPDFP